MVSIFLAVTLAIQVHGDSSTCAHGDDRDIDLLSSTSDSEAMTLLQVNARQVPSEEETDAVEQMPDVSIGVLGGSLLFLNKEVAASQTPFEAADSWFKMSELEMPDERTRSKAANKEPSGQKEIPVFSKGFSIAPLVWLFGSYHKTGCQLALSLCWILGGHPAKNINTEIFLGHHNNLFDTHAFSDWYFEPNIDLILNVPHYRFVHMIRMPKEQIVSAYRYHCHIQAKTEEFLQLPMNQGWCEHRHDCPQTYTRYGILPKLMNDKSEFQRVVAPEHRQLLHRLFEAVAAGKTLPQFYREATEHDGVIIEAYRSYATLRMMAHNYEGTRNDDRTLQLRMENIKSDFPKTMQCMFTFLSNSHKFDTRKALKLSAPLDVDKFGKKAALKAQPWHIDQEDNTELYKTLIGISFVREIHVTLSKPAYKEC